MTLTRSPFALRPMAVADLEQIGEVERESFPSVWPASAYKRELAENKLARYFVAVRRDRPAPEPPGLRGLLRRWLRSRRGEPLAPVAEFVSGFLGLWLMVDEAHIVTVAVRAAERQQGIGELLLLGAYDLAAAHGIPVLTLEVRVSNLPAQRLYEKYGFERMGVRKRYYTDNGEDALIMTTPSTDDPAYRARVDQLRARHEQRHGRAAIELPELT
jgi:[ribosomal protein S18]-alanine N-acetyltransferase